MRIETVEAEGLILDWIVMHAKIQTGDQSLFMKPNENGEGALPYQNGVGVFRPSKIWSQGGKLSEDERIEGSPWGSGSDWRARKFTASGMIISQAHGSSELEAKMRCLALFHVGQHCDVPDEIIALSKAERLTQLENESASYVSTETKHLDDLALDWAVGFALGKISPDFDDAEQNCPRFKGNWALSGPLCSQEHVSARPVFLKDEESPDGRWIWLASIPLPTGLGEATQYGHSEITAKLRAIVAKYLGETVELPAELSPNRNQQTRSRER